MARRARFGGAPAGADGLAAGPALERASPASARPGRRSPNGPCSRSSPASYSRRSWSSRCTSCSPGATRPAAGFAGGLLAGLALVVRYVAGGRYELGEAAPVEAGTLLGAGLLCAGLSGLGGLVLGGEVLQTAVLELDVPVLGHVKLVTSLLFDVGVYLIVVGLVLDILRSLGAELDRLGDAPAAPAPATTGPRP